MKLLKMESAPVDGSKMIRLNIFKLVYLGM